MIFIIRSYRDKKKANILLTEQKQEIIEKNEELNKQNEEISIQRDEIETQKNIVEQINHEVSESINYATRLQKAVLPEFDILTKYFPEFLCYLTLKIKLVATFTGGHM
jgi:enoyl-[acyl-carrier-protein] reductase (NADH)